MNKFLFVFFSFFASLSFNMLTQAAAYNEPEMTPYISLYGVDKYGGKYMLSLDEVELPTGTDQEQYKSLLGKVRSMIENYTQLSEERGEKFAFPTLDEWSRDKSRFNVSLVSEPATRECCICNENASPERSVRALHVDEYRNIHPDTFICEECLNGLPSDECPICREPGFKANRRVGTVRHTK